ncbi:MAG TPA: MarR family transcriptional regulator [Ktedonobacterales bacterium]
MSRDAQDQRAELLKELARELRRFNGLSASYFRAVAARSGMTATDMQVIESLASTGPTTAGQLADLTGLTTGAITGLLNRLEEAGVVRRERDPADGRRVIVQLIPDRENVEAGGPGFDSMDTAWDDLAARYDNEQLALLVEFLKRGNLISQQEILRLREAPAGEGGIYSAPLGEVEGGRLIFPTGAVRLTLRADAEKTALYQARFEGATPEVKVEDGVVTIRYPRRLWFLGGSQRSAEVSLNAAIPWRIVIQGGASDITAELRGLDLASLEMKGGQSMIRLNLPVPSAVVPIRLSGGASEITIRRPAGVAARVHLKGWASAFVFDEQRFSNLGNDVRLQSPDFKGMTPGYDIDVASSVSTATITTE